MGKNPSFVKPLQQRRQENIEKGAAQTRLSGAIPEEEIEKVVVEIISKTGASGMKDMGKVMGIVSGQLAGKADGKTISTIVKSKLS